MASCSNNCNCKKDEKIPQKVQNDFAYVCMSRTLNRLIAIVIVCICLLFASNATWLLAWTSYDYASYEAITDDGGDANIIGDDDDIYNGYGEVEKTD